MGRELRLQQRRRGARCPTTRAPTTSPSAPSGPTTAACCASATTGSWFDNLDDTLVWDSPLRLDDSTSAPGRGRMALWPSNSAQTVSVGGYTKLARRTQLTGFVSFGVWSNDEPLQPFTINPTLPQLALPRAHDRGEAQRLLDQPQPRVAAVRPTGGSARGCGTTTTTTRRRTRPSRSSSTTTRPSRHSSTGGPEPFAHSRHDVRRRRDVDAGCSRSRSRLGYTHNGNGYDFRIFESTGEDVLHAEGRRRRARSGSTFRAQLRDCRSHRLRPRRGAADRRSASSRRCGTTTSPTGRATEFTGQVDVVAERAVDRSALSAGFGKDDYDDSYFGLQEAVVPDVYRLGVDYQPAERLRRRRQLQLRALRGLAAVAVGESRATGRTDPLRDWTTDSSERVHYFSIYVTPPRIGATPRRGSPTTTPTRAATTSTGSCRAARCRRRHQLPEVFNKLQQLQLDVRHRSRRPHWPPPCRTSTSRSRVYDFAFDPTVVNSIVQPSSLVLGYVYRPYTAHSAVFGLMYRW